VCVCVCVCVLYLLGSSVEVADNLAASSRPLAPITASRTTTTTSSLLDIGIILFFSYCTIDDPKKKR